MTQTKRYTKATGTGTVQITLHPDIKDNVPAHLMKDMEGFTEKEVDFSDDVVETEIK